MMTGAGQGYKKTARLRVLIADDVQETRRSTRLMVSLFPALRVVAIAKDGLEAVEMARQHPLDIAIMDINMPGMDGITAIREMRRLHPNLVCIIISAERESQTLREAMAAGARGYLIKPFTVEEFEKVIRPAIEEAEAHRRTAEEMAQMRAQRISYLKQLARAFIKERRMDDQAMQVYEELAADPDCEMHWLTNLAVIYALRREWGKLKTLAERLEQKTLSIGQSR